MASSAMGMTRGANNLFKFLYPTQYNAIIYEKGTWNFFKISKLFMFESILIVTTMSLSMNNIIAFIKSLSYFLLQSSVLVIFIVENASFVVVVETRRVSTSMTTLQTSK